MTTQNKFTPESLAKIVQCYFDIITNNDLERILSARKESQYASFNLFNRAQLIAQDKEAEAIAQSLTNCLSSDYDRLVNIIKEVSR